MAAPRELATSIGHVSLRVRDVKASVAFYEGLGLSTVHVHARMAILELRGGTHLLLFKARTKPKGGYVKAFDLMVDDLDALKKALAARGVVPGPVQKHELSGHRMFDVTDPDGHTLSVCSSHCGPQGG